MATQTKPQQRTPTPPPATSKGQVAVLAPPRLLPPDDQQLSNYEVDNQGWRTLVESIFPAAKTTTSVMMALDYCKRRKLDIFKHPIHIVPIWNAQANDGRGAMVETIWPGINELRTTAIRTGQYAGMDVPVFGPIIERHFEGQIKVKRNGGDQWERIEATVQFPEWCSITVYRVLGGNRVPFPGPRVYWLETYSRVRNNCEVPNGMWEKRANGQLEKCAEAAALRRAFPEELGSDYSIDEIGAFTTHAPTDVIEEGHATTKPPEPQQRDFNAAGPAATPATGTPQAATPANPQPSGEASVAQNGGEAAGNNITDVPVDEPITFPEAFQNLGEFYQFSDTFLESTMTTPAMARQWEETYRDKIRGLQEHKDEARRAEIADTLKLYHAKIAGEKPAE